MEDKELREREQFKAMAIEAGFWRKTKFNAYDAAWNNNLLDLMQKTHDMDKWVPVGERLPEEETTDVLFYNAGYKMCFIGRLYDRTEKTFWDQSADTHTNVTHWQPLPKGPKQKD